MKRSAVMVVALGLDLALGEPPAALHPVVWFGRRAALLKCRRLFSAIAAVQAEPGLGGQG